MVELSRDSNSSHVGGHVMNVREVELVADVRCALAEGPLWLPGQQLLIWVDIVAGHVHRMNPATGDHVIYDAGVPVSAVVPRRDGDLVLVVEHGVDSIDASWRERQQLLKLPGPPDVAWRTNDAKADPAGRLWVGTLAYNEQPGAGALFRVDPDLATTTIVSAATIANGMAWTADRTTMYWVDTPTGRVDAFQYDLATGAVSQRRPAIEIADGGGMPDGLTIDTEDHLWVALFGGWQVRRYRPDGVLDGIVSVPAEQVTSCTFGGPDLTDLYITTARKNLDEEALREQPLAGGVFRCSPGVSGRSADAFGG
jgi:sugar lactone lactonase YvrE